MTNPDRRLDQLLRFAAYPSTIAPGAPGPRGARFAAFLRQLYRGDAEAFSAGWEGEQPRLRAALLGEPLAAAPEPEATNLLGQSALHLAVLTGNPALARRLLVTAQPNGRSRFPIATSSFARGEPQTGCARSAPPRLDQADRWGNTALHWAAMVGEHALLDELVAHGADPAARNAVGATAADLVELCDGPPSSATRVVEVVTADGAVDRWSAEQVAAELGLTLRDRSAVDDDLLFALYVRCRPTAELRARVQVQAERPAGVALRLRRFPPPLEWGVVLAEPAAAGQCLGSYVGRVGRLAGAAEHELDYASELGPLTDALGLAIFGRASGSLFTRANSSPDRASANLEARFAWCRGEPRCDMVACADLPAGTQLLWYYGDAYWRARGLTPR